MTRWNQFVRDYGPPTFRAAWRILRHAQDCEDVVQDVFIEAHEVFERDEIAHPVAFLNRLVTYRAIDLLRKRKPTNSIDDGEVLDNTVGPERTAIDQEETLRLRCIVADLPPRQAAVFCLVHFEQLSHDKVAETLEISNGAVAMALHKARAKLREVFMALRESDQ